ncbi:hypothetical protein [Curvibacter lanceolatus]|uniref:hypothetical protein n=1 Tax=Curvibacter lanceolatus TaxID=86182 RepID=UPI00037D5361|nr:hypothetical protein [Curvibacter lanceolatus]
MDYDRQAQKQRRITLEQILVQGAASCIATYPDKASLIAQGIRDALRVLLDEVDQPECSTRISGETKGSHPDQLPAESPVA